MSTMRLSSTEHYETMQRIRGSVHQNITRQGSQTITEPSIVGRLSIVELAGPVLIIGAHRAAHYSVDACNLGAVVWSAAIAESCHPPVSQLFNVLGRPKVALSCGDGEV